MQVGDFSLPVSMDPLPPGICYLSPLVNVPNVRWFDGHKCLFNVTLNLVSTVHTQVKIFLDVIINFFYRILILIRFLILIICLSILLKMNINKFLNLKHILMN